MKVQLDLTPDEVQLLLRALDQREMFLMSLWGERQLTQTSKERSGDEQSKVIGLREKILDAIH